MAVTTAELRAAVAEHLRISGVDVTLDSERAAIIDGKIDDVSAMLRELGLIWWPDDAIPAPCKLAMTLIVAAFAAAPCGKAGQDYEKGDPGGRAMLAMLRPAAGIDTQRASYF